jgi:hypothetical protein
MTEPRGQEGGYTRDMDFEEIGCRYITLAQLHKYLESVVSRFAEAWHGCLELTVLHDEFKFVGDSQNVKAGLRDMV